VGSSFPIIARYKFKNAFKVTVVINSISSQQWKDKLPPVFRLTGQILVERKYPFNPNAAPSLHLSSVQPMREDMHLVAGGPSAGLSEQSSAPGLQIINGQITFSWDAPSGSGAEEYDVEWTYIDEFSALGYAITHTYGGPDGPFTIPDGAMDQLMRNNNQPPGSRLPSHLIQSVFLLPAVIFWPVSGPSPTRKALIYV